MQGNEVPSMSLMRDGSALLLPSVGSWDLYLILASRSLLYDKSLTGLLDPSGRQVLNIIAVIFARRFPGSFSMSSLGAPLGEDTNSIISPGETYSESKMYQRLNAVHLSVKLLTSLNRLSFH